MRALRFSILIILFTLSIFSCGKEAGVSADEYNRSALLDTWANQLIVPAYEDYLTQLRMLKEDIDAYVSDIEDQATLDQVKEQLFATRLAWQMVDMFEIGPAEAVNLRLRSNTYPIDIPGIMGHINTGVYNLDLPTSISRQGFPTIEYLLFAEEVDRSDSNVASYLQDIIAAQLALSEEVLTQWNTGYAAEFIANDGQSATSAFNTYMNDYLFYYEKFLRAGKVGIPAGVFSGSALVSHVEARYDQGRDKALLQEAIVAFEQFYRGDYEGSYQGASIRDYLDYVAELRNAESLSGTIDARFTSIKQKLNEIDADFTAQIESDNISFLELYDELQALVVLIKVDVFSALNVKVDFVDADGD